MSEKVPMVTHPRPIYAWIILILSVLFNAYSFTMQSTPGIHNLMTGPQEKVIDSIYALAGFFYAFAIFQIPVGLIIDRFGSRFFPTLGILLCSIGVIYFSQTTTTSQMAIARFIMGAGGAFSFLNALKLISNWFQPKRFAFLVGMFVALGSLTIVFLKAVFEMLSETIHWQGAMLTFGVGGLVLACIFFFIVRDAPKENFSLYQPVKDKKDFWRQIKHVFKNPQSWIVGITVGLLVGPLFSFEAIWSMSFLSVVYKVPQNIAILFNTLFVIGYAIGSIYFARTSTSLGRRKIFIPWGIGFSLLMVLVILYPPYMGIQITAISFFMLGFAAGNINLGYVTVHEQNAPQVTATAVAVVNTFYALFAAISQSLIAIYLQTGATLQQTHSYTIKEYQLSLIRLPIYILIALIFSFFIKETYCKQVTKYDD